jgi:sugar O-acyltransferase (sialic acid O-acetyltransferase NeuD family)
MIGANWVKCQHVLPAEHRDVHPPNQIFSEAKSNDMLIVGAGGCATDLLAMLEREATWTGVHPMGALQSMLTFFDDVNSDAPDLFFGKYPVLRSKPEAANYLKNIDKRFVVATGSPAIREKLQRQFESLGGVPTSVISSHSQIGNYNHISERGVIIMHNVTITNRVTIGQGTLINMGCIIGHGAIIGNFCELSPGVTFSSCRVGDRCHLGICVALVPGVEIGDDVVAGVGAVVTKNISAGKIIKGVPAS